MGCNAKSTVKLWGASLALLFMVLAAAAQADVYRWVDENGKIRYGDTPPKQGEHTQLRAPTAPVASRREAVPSEPALTEEEWNQKAREDYRKKMEEGDRFRKDQAEKNRADQEARERAERERQEAARKRQQEQEAEKKARDDELVAECRRNRENYCDKGVGTIRSEQETLRLWQEEEGRKARRGDWRRY